MSRSIKQYYNAVLTLRKFVDGFSPSDGFDFSSGSKITPSQKRKITMTMEKLTPLLSRNVKIYRPRKKQNLSIAQHEAHGGVRIKGMRVALVPVSDSSAPVDIKIKNGRLITKQKGVIRELINIDPFDLARNAVEAVNRAIESSSAKRFGIQAGEYQVESKGAEKNKISPIATRQNIAKNVAKLVENYGEDKFNPDDKNSHYFGNWLFGIIGYTFEEFEDFREYQATYSRERRAILDSPFAKRVLRLTKGKKAIKKRAVKKIGKRKPLSRRR